MMKNSRKTLVAGNWKMNGNLSLVAEFSEHLTSHQGVEVVICPPACYIPLMSNESIKLGAQDVSALSQGAHTGDLAAQMLQEVGCSYVIVGHSERRTDHNESNALVANKTKAILAQGLTPIVCIGESLSVREAGTVNEFIAEQLKAITDALSVEELALCVIAYEPIWAIGTGKTASPEQAQEVHAFIRHYIGEISEAVAEGMTILYGGSVKADNAKEIFAQADVDGGLIGGASLKLDDFTQICQAAS